MLAGSFVLSGLPRMGSIRRARRRPFMVGASPRTGRAAPLTPTGVEARGRHRREGALDTRPANQSSVSSSSPNQGASLRPSPETKRGRKALMPDLKPQPRPRRQGTSSTSPLLTPRTLQQKASAMQARCLLPVPLVNLLLQVAWCTSYPSGKRSSRQTIGYWRLFVMDTPSS